MNARKIKLALTAALINHSESDNVLGSVKDVMKKFVGEVGDFLGLTPVGQLQLNASTVKETYRLQYEHVSVNIDLISNPMRKIQSVQRFEVR